MVAAALLFAGITAQAQYQWESPTNKIVLLAVNAHPDDEGIFFGGTLPYYAAALGLPTMLVSMTSGDWYPTSLTIREAELRCAARNYGLRYEPLFPRFRDVPSQSMPGNPYTNKIDATWDYWADGVLDGDGSDVEAGKLKAIAYLAEQIRRYRPDVVITHDVQGEYGHHNHIATTCAVTNAFFMAADPTASATNLAGLPPWQVKKLYLHIYPSNRLFHNFTELRLPELSNRSSRDLAEDGLNCHVSQRSPDVATVYRTGENYDSYPSEWWGLYASTVGPDTVLTNDLVVSGGYTVPAGASVGNFLEHLGITSVPSAPAFVDHPILPPVAAVGRAYSWSSSSAFATDPNLAWGDTLSFAKVSGPAWLTVGSNGGFSGMPGVEDRGTNVFTIRVVDSTGLHDEALALIFVQDPFPDIPNLAGWWKLDDQAGAPCADSALPAQNGTFLGSVEFATSGATPATGLSARFNGIDGKADVPFSPDLNPGVFSAALWVKVLGGAGAYRSPLTSRESIPHAGYMFYAAQNNTWQFWVGAGGAWKTLSAGTVETNVWMHLVGTYDGTTARLFTNGVLAASVSTVFQPNAVYPLRIGSGGSESSGQYWFPGYVDDVRVYSVALSAEQIGSLFSNRPPQFVPEPQSATVFAGTPFSGSLSASSNDQGDVLTYGKLSGPDWLRVGTNGLMSGIPASGTVGSNYFEVAVSDSHGAMDTARFEVCVLPGRMPSFTGAAIESASGIKLTLSGDPGQTYIIEASPVLVGGAWEPVATNISGATLFEWSDPEFARKNQRFYRVVIP